LCSSTRHVPLKFLIHHGAYVGWRWKLSPWPYSSPLMLLYLILQVLPCLCDVRQLPQNARLMRSALDLAEEGNATEAQQAVLVDRGGQVSKARRSTADALASMTAALEAVHRTKLKADELLSSTEMHKYAAVRRKQLEARNALQSCPAAPQRPTVCEVGDKVVAKWPPFNLTGGDDPWLAGTIKHVLPGCCFTVSFEDGNEEVDVVPSCVVSCPDRPSNWGKGWAKDYTPTGCNQSCVAAEDLHELEWQGVNVSNLTNETIEDDRPPENSHTRRAMPNFYLCICLLQAVCSGFDRMSSGWRRNAI